MFKYILKAIKIIVPTLLIVYILSKIDIDGFTSLIQQSDPTLLSSIVLSIPLQYLLYNFRWFTLTQWIDQVRIPFFKLHSILYQGLFVGFFVPGGVGIDVFRVIKTLKFNKSLKANIGTIFLEKLIGTFSSLLLVAICSLFLVSKNELLSEVLHYVYIFIVAIALLILLISYGNTVVSGKLKLLLEKFTEFINERILLLIKRISKSTELEDKNASLVSDILIAIKSIKNILFVLSISIAILVVKAFFFTIAFKACGFDVDFFVSLFVIPLVNIISLMPISFGGVGVRETSYIMLFGIWSVPPEASLFASLITFTLLLLNIAFGGILLLRNN